MYARGLFRRRTQPELGAWAVLAVRLLVPCLFLGQHPHLGLAQADRQAEIELFVTSSGVVLAQFQAILTEESTGRTRKFTEGRLEAVPYGSYQVRVQCDGFYSAEVPVRVSERRVWLPISLALGTSWDQGDVSASGRVENVATRKLGWLKLVSLHGDATFATRVMPDGSFSFTVPYRHVGKYLLLLMDGPLLVRTERLTVAPGIREINLK